MQKSNSKELKISEMPQITNLNNLADFKPRKIKSPPPRPLQLPLPSTKKKKKFQYGHHAFRCYYCQIIKKNCNLMNMKYLFTTLYICVT